MKIVFLGGTGFVGAHAVRKLADLGHDVTVAHLGHTEPDLPASVRHVHHPSAPNGRFGRHGQFLTDVADELRGLEWDVAVDMNPESDVDAGIVMETFRHVARRVVAISSMDVYRGYAVMHRRDPGPPQPVTFTEESDLREQLFIDAPASTRSWLSECF